MRVPPVAIVAGFALWGIFGADLDDVSREIHRRFPEVRSISTAQLARELESGEDLVLIDVRSAKEFEVSHLRGARRVEPGSSAAVLGDMDRERPIVTYCSVGYRSAQFAQTLLDAGFSDVRNLEGSIFRWANEGRPVYRDGRRVQTVHPYNFLWGLLLDRRYHP